MPTPSPSPSRALAIALLETHRHDIARGIFRFACRVEPMVATIPEPTSVGSITGFIRGLEVFLRSGDASLLSEIVKATVSLRRLGGFDWTAVVAMSHCYLPVIRKAFLRHAPDRDAALRAYDDVESAVVPFIAMMLRELLRSPGPAEVAAGFDAIARTEETPERPAFELVSVDDT
jgi:hypothetical protein